MIRHLARFLYEIALAGLLLCPYSCSPQDTGNPMTPPSPPPTDIIPADRLIDWNGAGVFVNGLRGIPNYSVAINVKNAPYKAKGDGVTDDTAAIQNAIDACPEGKAILIPQGTYRISGSLRLSRGIAVRGDGPDKTKIIQHSVNHIFRIAGPSASGVADVLSGYTKGSDTVVVADPGSFRVGDVVAIDQLNDPALVTQVGVGTCNWCGRYGVQGTRAMGEAKLVQEITGNTIKFHHPLYYTYKADFLPQLVRVTGSPVRNAGIEDLYMESVAGSGLGIVMFNCVYCWVERVEGYNTPGKHVDIQTGALGNEVRDSYFHDAQFFTSDRGYGVDISLQSCDNLVENNILYHLHFPIALEASGAGNVIAYNYIERTEHDEPDWYIQAMGTHGAHTYMNLWEGNIAGMIDFDNYWGSGSHQLVLRNHFTRENPGTPVKSNIVAAIVDANNYYDTFMGNILGTPGCSGVVEQNPYRSTWLNPVLWKIGFRCCSATGNPSDSATANTLIRHGNYDYITNGLTWDSTISSHDIPDSQYLSSKPAWFKSLPWPPFAPEAQDFDPNKLNKIPAQVCYENGPKIGLPFEPRKYY